MSEFLGTVVRGIKAPIIKQGDNLVDIVTDCVLAASKHENFELRDRDVLGMTEAIVARSQGNYATVDQIASDIASKFEPETLGLVFPILSRNRFSMLLKGISKPFKKVVIMLSYPSDEVGNPLVTFDQLDEKGINPYSDLLNLEQYTNLFGNPKHLFTDVNYVQFYQEIVNSNDTECEIIFCNNPRRILEYTDQVLCGDIHTRFRTKRLLLEAGAKKVLCLDELMTSSVDGSGYNEKFGILGSNQATDNSVKLFPRDGEKIVSEIQKVLFEKTGKHVEVMIYGDGAFKDPIGKIWELADPCVSPAFTSGLVGQPEELKLKYLADNEFSNLSGEELRKALVDKISHKADFHSETTSRLGTTPRQLTDLIGSLCDLTSGSGDKGTPIIYIQGYFDNYATDKSNA